MLSLKEANKKTNHYKPQGKSLSARQVGRMGESVAVHFLSNARNFRILDRNARSRMGEVDIVCEKGEILHFVEVKSTLVRSNGNLSSESSPYFCNLDEMSSGIFNAYDPVFRVNSRKISRIKKAAAYYMQRNDIQDREIVFDLITVYVFEGRGFCRVSYHSNIFV